ncbi:MAG: YcxB family protein [Clostridia bacterium]|nr:YcxB family protein [Clostridia bacterium]
MIKASVTYDKAALSALMKYNAVKSPSDAISMGIATALMIAATVFSIGTAIFTIFSIALAFVLAFDFIMAFNYFVKPIMKLKGFNDENAVINNFIFTDESILITSKSKVKTGSSTVKYGWIIKACETKKSFYLFLNKKGCLIITKNEITEGTEDGLRALLNSKISAKRNKLSKTK